MGPGPIFPRDTAGTAARDDYPPHTLGRCIPQRRARRNRRARARTQKKGPRITQIDTGSGSPGHRDPSSLMAFRLTPAQGTDDAAPNPETCPICGISKQRADAEHPKLLPDFLLLFRICGKTQRLL